MIFFQHEELVILTGYKRPADQIRWLRRNGYDLTVNRLGRPVVRKDKVKGQSTEPQLGAVR